MNKKLFIPRIISNADILFIFIIFIGKDPNVTLSMSYSRALGYTCRFLVASLISCNYVAFLITNSVRYMSKLAIHNHVI